VDAPSFEVNVKAIRDRRGPGAAMKYGTRWDDTTTPELLKNLGMASVERLKNLDAVQKDLKAAVDLTAAQRDARKKGVDTLQSEVAFMAPILAKAGKAKYAETLQTLRQFAGSDGIALLSPEAFKVFPKDFTDEKGIRDLGLTAQQTATDVRQSASDKVLADHRAWLRGADARERTRRESARPMEVMEKILEINRTSANSEEAQKKWRDESGFFTEAYDQLDMEWANRVLRGGWTEEPNETAQERIVRQARERAEGGGGRGTGAAPTLPATLPKLTQAEVTAALANAEAGRRYMMKDGSKWDKNADGTVTPAGR
jgi:hypothetical protein